MSSASIKSPKSPSKQWLSNDDQSLAPRRSSENVPGKLVVSSKPASPEPLIASTNVDEKDETSNAPPMSYPIDENLFYSAPSQPLADTFSTEGEDVGQAVYSEPAAEDVLPAPDFKPFFTLIEDRETGEHHHPTVHYIFSDDDPEILTSAALEALDAYGKDAQQADRMDGRYVIVDLAADGKTVVSASSLSKDWQAVRTSITQAPSWGDSAQSEDKGVMMRISGKESKPVDRRKERRRSPQGADGIEAMVAAFAESLHGLDEDLGSAEDLRGEAKDAE